jgi:hypothetical protein
LGIGSAQAEPKRQEPTMTKTEAAIALYTVEQTETGTVLYSGPATSEADALDRMAREAGYADFASIPAEIGGRDTLSVARAA